MYVSAYMYVWAHIWQFFISNRKLKKAAAKAALSNKKSLRNRVYSGLVSRAGVTKTSVFVRIFTASTLRRDRGDTRDDRDLELDDAQTFTTVRAGDIAYRQIY